MIDIVGADCVRLENGTLAGFDPAGTEKNETTSYEMEIRTKRTMLTGAGEVLTVFHMLPAGPAAPAFRNLTVQFTEAQVEETLHQFESASSQGEGNG